MNLLSHSVICAGALCLAACSSVTPTPPAEAPKAAAEAPKPASKASESQVTIEAKAPTPSQSTAASTPKAPVAPRQTGAAKPAAATPAPKPAARPEAPGAKAPAVAQAVPPKPAPLNLKTLEQRLKDTNAIGVLTKLSLKNQVDDLVGHFRAYHDGRRPPTLAELRPGFELLLMKVLSLLQDKDSALAHDINASRDAIWTVLADKQKFAEFS